MPILTLLFSLFSGLPGMVGDYFKKKQEIEQTKLDNQLQLQLANANLIAQQSTSEANLQMTALNATSSVFKEKTFYYCTIPILISICLPKYAVTMWHNLDLIPDFYKTMYCGMICAIWGLPRAADWFGRAVDSSRTYKLAKIDRKSYYEALKKTKGVVSDADVKEMEPVFDEMDKESTSG